MCSNKTLPLSLNGETFKDFKADFDQMLYKLLTEMERLDSEEATISVKMTVNLEADQERDFEANGYDAMKDITKPTFKHEISTVMQIKNKKTGQLGGNMKLVWDHDSGKYVLRDIDNGQTSMFDEEAPAKPEVPALPDGVIDADYEPVEDREEEDGEYEDGEQKDASDGDTETSDGGNGAFDYMMKFVGEKVMVCESGDGFEVRTESGKVVLSTNFAVTDRFYCSPSVLEPHVGHELCCLASPDDEEKPESISIWCNGCDAMLFIMDDPNIGKNDYGYEEAPEEAPDEDSEE